MSDLESKISPVRCEPPGVCCPFLGAIVVSLEKGTHTPLDESRMFWEDPVERKWETDPMTHMAIVEEVGMSHGTSGKMAALDRERGAPKKLEVRKLGKNRSTMK